MKSISNILDNAPVSPYTGSEITRDMVLSQIIARYGKAEGKNYDPFLNCRTFAGWLKVGDGYRVKKGEKALKSITYVEKKDDKGNVVGRFKRTVCLFYEKQVEPVTKK